MNLTRFLIIDCDCLILKIKDNVKFTRAQNQKKLAKLASISEKYTNSIKNLNEKDIRLSQEVTEMRLVSELQYFRFPFVIIFIKIYRF